MVFFRQIITPQIFIVDRKGAAAQVNLSSVILVKTTEGNLQLFISERKQDSLTHLKAVLLRLLILYLHKLIIGKYSLISLYIIVFLN
ncbi:hypothetical protein Barb7_02292 [Bacteroidales bacterium Barb7]|nr:hypothetical protein Barb7_02292 [Bacteroidales bacterium Barb7]